MSHLHEPLSPGEHHHDPLDQSLSLPGDDAHQSGSRALQMPPQPMRSLDGDALQSIQRHYPNLTELALDNNELRFSTISPHLSLYLPSLRSLHLSFNQLERIPAMGALTQLTSLNLKGNTISHIEHLSGCRRLEHLDLAQNQISDLPSLLAELAGECPSLTSFNLQQNSLSPPQYRVALISLLGCLRTLDGVAVRAEEKAYLQLLAATHVDESSEGQQSEQRSAEAEQQGEPSSSHTVPAGVAPARASASMQDRLHVENEEDLSDHVSSPLLISAGPSSVVSTPRGNQVSQQPMGRAQEAAIAHADAEAHHQRQEQHRRDAEEQAAERREIQRNSGEPQSSVASSHQAGGFNSFSPQAAPNNAPGAQPHPQSQEHSSPSSENSSVRESPAQSPVVQPMQPSQQAMPQLPSSSRPSAAPAVSTAVSQPRPVYNPVARPEQLVAPPSHLNAWQSVPQLHYHLPPHPPAAQSYPAPPPAVASPAVNAALEHALASQTQMVQSLQKELQEMKSNLAREQAHVRTVKAYYQPEQQRPSSASAAPSASHSRRSSAAPPPPSSSLLPFPSPPAPISAPSSQAMDSLRLEITHLKKQKELLQIQNETTQEILRMKDKQTEEHHRAQAQAQRQSGRAVATESDLSILWRDKVFALLVQNKSLLLTHASDIRGYKQQLLDKSQTITQLEQQALLLNKSNAALQNQIQLVHNEASHQLQVQEQAHLMQTQALAASARTARDVQGIRHIFGVFADAVTKMEDSMRSRLDSKLLQFNSRLEFARKRVQVVQAIKGRKGELNGSYAAAEFSLAASAQDQELDDADNGDINNQHLRREIQRLQADRSLIYSSWQKEVASLREQIYTHSSSISSAESALKSSQSSLAQLQSEMEFLRAQNNALIKEGATKVPEGTVRELKAEQARRVEQLEAELAAVRSSMVELQQSSDAAHRSHLKTQVELSQARHALSTAQANTLELSAAKYDYLEEKLRRKERTVEELSQDKKHLQERLKEMEQERILMRYGVVQPNGIARNGNSVQNGQHSNATAPAVSSSSLLPVPSRHAAVGSSVGVNPISNLLFGSASVPVLASYHPAQQPPFHRPQPVQPQWQSHTASGLHDGGSSAAALPSSSSLPTATGSLLHNHPIPAVFGASAAALEQQLSASASAASTRQSSRMHSVAPSPLRPSAAVARDNANNSHPAPHIPPLHFPAAAAVAASNASSARPPQGVSSLPLAAMAGAVSSAAAAAAAAAPASSRSHSADVSRKLSHLAALSARLLDDD